MIIAWEHDRSQSQAKFIGFSISNVWISHFVKDASTTFLLFFLVGKSFTDTHQKFELVRYYVIVCEQLLHKATAVKPALSVLVMRANIHFLLASNSEFTVGRSLKSSYHNQIEECLAENLRDWTHLNRKGQTGSSFASSLVTWMQHSWYASGNLT